MGGGVEFGTGWLNAPPVGHMTLWTLHTVKSSPCEDYKFHCAFLFLIPPTSISAGSSVSLWIRLGYIQNLDPLAGIPHGEWLKVLLPARKLL